MLTQPIIDMEELTILRAMDVTYCEAIAQERADIADREREG